MPCFARAICIPCGAAQLSQTSPGVHGLREEGTHLQPGCSTPLPPHLFFVRSQRSWLHNKEHRGNTHLETSQFERWGKTSGLSRQAWLDARGRKPEFHFGLVLSACFSKQFPPRKLVPFPGGICNPLLPQAFMDTSSLQAEQADRNGRH